jgi:hypothetical protein
VHERRRAHDSREDLGREEMGREDMSKVHGSGPTV